MKFPVAQWLKDLALPQLGADHTRGTSSIPGPGISTCLKYGQEKKKKGSFFFKFILMATPAAYGSSPARN